MVLSLLDRCEISMGELDNILVQFVPAVDTRMELSVSVFADPVNEATDKITALVEVATKPPLIPVLRYKLNIVGSSHRF